MEQFCLYIDMHAIYIIFALKQTKEPNLDYRMEQAESYQWRCHGAYLWGIYKNNITPQMVLLVVLVHRIGRYTIMVHSVSTLPMGTQNLERTMMQSLQAIEERKGFQLYQFSYLQTTYSCIFWFFFFNLGNVPKSRAAPTNGCLNPLPSSCSCEMKNRYGSNQLQKVSAQLLFNRLFDLLFRVFQQRLNFTLMLTFLLFLSPLLLHVMGGSVFLSAFGMVVNYAIFAT